MIHEEHEKIFYFFVFFVFLRITIRLFLVFLVRFSCSHFHKVLVRYRYRSYPAFSIASSDIDSDPERTTTPVAARRAMFFVDRFFKR